MKSGCRFSPRLLWEYQEGMLDERGRAQVERHLHQCEVCRSTLAADRVLFEKLRSMRPTAAPESARPPQWSPALRQGWPARIRWAVTVVGVAVLAALALGVFHLVGERTTLGALPEKGMAMTDASVEMEESRLHHPETQAAPPKAEIPQITDQKEPSAGIGEAIPGATPPPRPSVERAPRYQEPVAALAAPERVSQKKLDEGKTRKPDQPKLQDTTEGAGPTGPSAEGPGEKKVEPKGPQITQEGDVVDKAPGEPRGRETTDKTTTTLPVARVGQLQEDGRVAPRAELRWPDRLLLTEEDGFVYYLRYGAPNAGADLPKYLTRPITLHFLGTLEQLAAPLAAQAETDIAVEGEAKGRKLEAEFRDVEFGLAMAHIALATEVEWQANADRVTVSAIHPARRALRARLAKTDPESLRERFRGYSQQMGPADLTVYWSLSEVACPSCGRPSFAPLWRFCPFCGQKLQAKPETTKSKTGESSGP